MDSCTLAACEDRVVCRNVLLLLQILQPQICNHSQPGAAFAVQLGYVMNLYAYCAHAKAHGSPSPELRDIARWCSIYVQKCADATANSAAANLQPFVANCGTLCATQQWHRPECALSTATSAPWSKAGVKRCCMVAKICGQKHSVATANSMPANR